MTFWVGTGWKMNKTLAEGLDYAEKVAAGVSDLDTRIQPFVLPPYTALREVVRALADTRIRVGAQNMHWAESGAWTGEISPTMLRDCGASVIELGHSERRAHFNETNQTVGWKTEAAIRHGFVPLICIGETLEERESGAGQEVLIAQVEGALEFLDDDQERAEILFAYEPVWAIGEHGIPASPDYADEQQALIGRTAGASLSAIPPVLYGGSVNPENAKELFGRDHIDGLFVGRAAWTAEGYLNILRLAEAVLPEPEDPASHDEPSTIQDTESTKGNA